MNFSDSEIVASVMAENGYATTAVMEEADVIFLNTCAIREKRGTTRAQAPYGDESPQKERPHLMVGVLGCMAERSQEKFLEEEKLVDLVVGPDAYRDLPALVERTEGRRQNRSTYCSHWKKPMPTSAPCA